MCLADALRITAEPFTTPEHSYPRQLKDVHRPDHFFLTRPTKTCPLPNMTTNFTKYDQLTLHNKNIVCKVSNNNDLSRRDNNPVRGTYPRTDRTRSAWNIVSSSIKGMLITPVISSAFGISFRLDSYIFSTWTVVWMNDGFVRSILGGNGINSPHCFPVQILIKTISKGVELSKALILCLIR